jgi:hypothetical protein
MSMLTYRQWDAIADSYIPLLFIIVLSHLFWLWRHRRRDESAARLVYLLIASGFVYSLMAFDLMWPVWPRFGLDYSTHTAAALVLVFYLGSIGGVWMISVTLSFLLYVLLMLYQDYHSLADVMTTAVPVSLVLWILLRRFVSSPASRSN